MFNNIENQFKSWADGLYRGWGVNLGFEKEVLRNDFLRGCPEHRISLTMKAFRQLLWLYCKQNGFQFNPHRSAAAGWRDKSNGREYYFVCNEEFDAGNLCRLNSIN